MKTLPMIRPVIMLIGTSMAFTADHNLTNRHVSFAAECEQDAAVQPLVIDVWPGKPADDGAETIAPEKFRELIVDGKPYQVAGKPTRWLTNVTRPTLSVYCSSPDTNTARKPCSRDWRTISPASVW